MQRSKKIVLLCHCILNANSKVEGLATYSSIMKDVFKELIDKEIGIIQLPCPELTMMGIKRWGQTKEQYDTPAYRKHCRELFQPILDQLVDYDNHEYEIVGLLGIDGSPSCGVDKTCCGDWGGELSGNSQLEAILDDITVEDESGVFIEEIEDMLDDAGLDVPFMGIDESNMAKSYANIKHWLKNL